jgi:hypothetical protein
VRSSSLNCYIFDALEEDTIETKASLLSQEFKFADPCTFRLVVKNVTALSPPAIRDAAYAQVRAARLCCRRAVPGLCCCTAPARRRPSRAPPPARRERSPTRAGCPAPAARRWTRWC